MATKMATKRKTIVTDELEEEPIKPKLDLRRKKAHTEEEPVPESPAPVSSPIEKALDLAFNPSREKLPEVTIIDRMQGRLFPVIDVLNIMWADVLEVAHYRQDKDEYRRVFRRSKPVSLNWLAELLFHTAQWQKSVQGTNLTKITDIALAEVETRAGDEGEGIGGVDAWGKE